MVKKFTPSKNTLSHITSKLSFLKHITLNQVLVTLLIGASFVIGMLYTKIQYLEKGGAVPEQNIVGAQGQPVPSGPPPKVEMGLGQYPIKGDKGAKVEIVEFADFRCPFCEKFYQETMKQIVTEYVDTGKARLAYRNYAFLGPASIVAANAAECANEQDGFWAMHDWLFDNQPPESDTALYTVDGMTEAAATLGLNTEQFRSCLEANKYNDRVDKDIQEGQTGGVGGTPTTFINGVAIVGAQPYATFKAAIDAELNK